MKKSELQQIIREELKTAISELSPDSFSKRDINFDTKNKVKKIVQGIAKEYGYSEDDAVMYLMRTLKTLGYIKDYTLNP